MLVTLLFVVALVSLVLSQAALAHSSTRTVLEFGTMAGNTRPYVGAAGTIRGVPGGGLPWVNSEIKGELKSDGKLEIKVTGLVIDPNDAAAQAAGVAGTNPAPGFRAIVSCLSIAADGTASTVNTQTDVFPATPQGNAKIEARLSLPSPCIAPIVVVTSPAGAWFAATGF
jgi:hypothetical protein